MPRSGRVYTQTSAATEGGSVHTCFPMGSLEGREVGDEDGSWDSWHF